MTGRLSTLAAALVVARRDFTAILFSRSFFFFLLGPLFPVVVGAMAGRSVTHSAVAPETRAWTGVVMNGGMMTVGAGQMNLAYESRLQLSRFMWTWCGSRTMSQAMT